MGLGSIIHERLFEPRVLEGFLRCDSLLGVVNEDPFEEIEELSVEVGVSWDGFLLVLVAVMALRITRTYR